MTKEYEELDITDKLYTYFDNVEDIELFTQIIINEFNTLKTLNYENIQFVIEPRSYSEYGDSYTDIRYVFSYDRDLTEDELKLEELEKQKQEQDNKIFTELVGKLSTNSIGSIIANEDLRQLYLEGKIKI